MLYLGKLAKDGTRSIYDMDTGKEVANVYQEETEDRVIFRIEPKKFLSKDHVEDYEKWLTLLKNNIKKNPVAREKEISFIRVDDTAFDEAMKKL